MTRRSRRASRAESIVERAISPVAASQGSVVAKADQRCTCTTKLAAQGKLNPTCPIHGHGRPAGRGV